MCADLRNVRYTGEIRLGNRKLTVKMVLGDQRDLTRLVTGAPLVASLGANTGALHPSYADFGDLATRHSSRCGVP
jgi:hypothetical protein